jgi:hypothetical protein
VDTKTEYSGETDPHSGQIDPSGLFVTFKERI